MGNRINDAEEWRAVVGYEGYYEVSNQGRVRSLDRMVYAGQGRERRHVGRTLALHDGDNYIKVRLKRDGGGRTWNVHTLVAAAFHGPCPDGLEICHNNGNAHDNRAENLRYDTHRANNWDKVLHDSMRYTRRYEESCVHGHPYEPGSYYISKETGGKKCLVCDRIRGARYRAEKHRRNGTVPRAERTECHYGHPLDGLSSAGKRFCKTCQRTRWKKTRKNKRRT